MKSTIYIPQKRDDGVVVEYTESFVLDKKTEITVPNQYTAVFFDNEKIAFRIEPCVEKSIVKEYGKELLGHTVQIAFIHTKAIPEAMWGFGNVQVNNERLNEAYRVGANGTYSIRVSSYAKLLGSFPIGGDITVDHIKEKLISIIKPSGISILSGCFANTRVSVFEIGSLLGDIRSKMQETLLNDEKIKSMGIELASLTVAGVHVNEDDLQMIRDRINAPSLEKQESKGADLHEVMAQVADMLKTFGQSIASEIDEKIQELTPLQDQANEKSIQEIRVDTQFLIDQAKADADLIAPASVIYSNIEENLIRKFHLPHENKRFVLSYDEYLLWADRAVVDGQYLLKTSKGNGDYRVFVPRVVESYENGSPKVVEMLPVIRFMKAGLEAEKAKRASDIWTVLNRIRHNSPENAESLSDYFDAIGKSRKEYLSEALAFFRENGLYTKD